MANHAHTWWCNVGPLRVGIKDEGERSGSFSYYFLGFSGTHRGLTRGSGTRLGDSSGRPLTLFLVTLVISITYVWLGEHVLSSLADKQGR